MSHFKSFIALLALSIGYSAISACHDANAGSGVSQAEFDAIVARVESLEAQQHRVLADVAVSSFAKAGEVPEAVGTLLSFDGSPSVATTANVRSPKGYLFATDLVTGAMQGPGGNIGGLLRYDSFDCTGQAYVGAGDIGGYAARQGLVFRILQQDGSDLYYTVEAGTEVLASATYHSFYAWGAGCTAQDADLPAYPVLLNDSVDTGIESAPVTDVTVG